MLVADANHARSIRFDEAFAEARRWSRLIDADRRDTLVSGRTIVAGPQCQHDNDAAGTGAAPSSLLVSCLTPPARPLPLVPLAVFVGCNDNVIDVICCCSVGSRCG